MTEGYLYRFVAPGKLVAEVRFDELRFAHTIPMRGRLASRQTTLRLPDLILSKLLILDLKTPDAWDLFALFAEDAESKRLDLEAWSRDREYLLDFLCKSWGAWYTANLTLGKLEVAFERLGESPSKADANAIRATMSGLRSQLAAGPKSVMWRARAIIGRHWRWFEETAEVPEHHLSGDGKE